MYLAKEMNKMSQFDFDRIPKRIGTNCTKWDNNLKTWGDKWTNDMIPMWIADMDFESPPEIIDALSDRINKGVFSYTTISLSFGQTVSNWLNKRFNIKIEPSWINFSPGVMPGISNIIQALSKVGEGVIIQPPVYYPFFSVVRNNNRVLVFNNLIETDGSYCIDFADLRAKAAVSETKIMIICNPHNPVGRVWRRDELEKMGTICLENNVLMIVDEIHSDIIYKPFKHVSFMTMPEKIRNNSIVLMSPSKTFNLAGLQTSAVIISNERIRKIFCLQSEITKTNSINCLGELALETAYNQCEYYADELLDYLEINRQMIYDFISKQIPTIKAFNSEGTYLMWIDMRSTGISNDEIEVFMINDAKIAVDLGEWFGETGKGFIRLNFACPRSILIKALFNIKYALDERMSEK